MKEWQKDLIKYVAVLAAIAVGLMLLIAPRQVRFDADAAVYVRTDAGEVRLPDEAAQEVVDVFNGYLGWGSPALCDCAMGFLSLQIEDTVISFNDYSFDHCHGWRGEDGESMYLDLRDRDAARLEAVLWSYGSY